MNTQGCHIKLPGLGAQFSLVSASLVPGNKEGASLVIDGHQYRIVTSGQDKSCINKIMQDLEKSEFKTFEKFKKKLSRITGGKPEIIPLKIHSLGAQALLNKSMEPQVGEWKQKENENLSIIQQSVAEAYWNKFVAGNSNEDHSHVGIRSYIAGGNEQIEKQFDKALNEQDFELFASIFSKLSLIKLNNINLAEGLECEYLDSPKPAPGEHLISDENIVEIQEYMRDIGFEGVVCLSDGKRTERISSDDAKFPPNTLFCTLSLTKVFTGMLILKLILKSAEEKRISAEEKGISEDTLKKPLQLNPEILEKLSPEVCERLSKTSMLQAMTHKAALGDYLQGYLGAINAALDEGNENKVKALHFNNPADFLAYADTEVLDEDKIGQFNYSNLGILLCGLSIEHHTKQSYQEILHQEITDSLGIELHGNPPEGSKASTHNPVDLNTSGSPAGGCWAKPEDLLKLCKWIYEACKSNPELRRLVDEYGTEFAPLKGVVDHSGDTANQSAYILSTLDSPFSVAIAAPQGECISGVMRHAIVRNLLS